MLEYREIALRPVVRGDLAFLFQLLTDSDRFHLWGHRRICDEAQFVEMWRFWSTERMGGKFIVTRRGEPAGLVFDYERSVEDGHAKIATILTETASGSGAGVIATGLFSMWLFQSVPLRKLYLEVYGFNTQVVRMLEKLSLRREMLRVDHRFWDGRYWDHHGYSMHRSDFETLKPRLFRSRPIRKHSQVEQPHGETDLLGSSHRNQLRRRLAPRTHGDLIDSALGGLAAASPAHS